MKNIFENNPEMAEILGAFIGDGWIEKRGTAFYITGSPTEDKEYYDTVIGPFFSRQFEPVLPRMFPYWGVYGIGCYKRAIIKKASDIGFCCGKKAKVISIPAVIFGLNTSIKRAVIRGIFDTDGSFYCQKAHGKYDSEQAKKFNKQPRIVLSVVSGTLIEQVSTLLTELNIEHTTSVVKAQKLCNRNNSTTYKLWINKRDSIERYFSIVNTHNPRHATRYKVWKKLGHLPPNTTIEERNNILRGKQPYDGSKEKSCSPERALSIGINMNEKRQSPWRTSS